jgi:hypothetical protein
MVLAFGILGVALAFAGETMVPEVTDMAGAEKMVISFANGEGGASFLIRSAGNEHKATCALPTEGIEKWKLALIAATDKDGAINGYSLVTWKPGDIKEDTPTWPDLKSVPGATARVRGSQTVLLRRFAAPASGPAKWGFELISFRKLEPKDEDDPVVRAKKETIEEDGARLIEDRRFTLLAPELAGESPRYGVLLTPAWKDKEKRVLDGFDAQLVSTPAPAKTARE